MFPNNIDISKICNEYLEGMQWILNYYTTGVTSWTWYYPYHYAPFASQLAKYINTYKFIEYGPTVPLLPLVQLLAILPPKSSQLLPNPLDTLLTDKDSPLKPFCPDKIKIDLSGKRKEWEGVTIIPMIDVDIVKEEYSKIVDRVDPKELNRNKFGKTFMYKYDKNYTFNFKSYYGNINDCKVRMGFIDI